MGVIIHERMVIVTGKKKHNIQKEKNSNVWRTNRVKKSAHKRGLQGVLSLPCRRHGVASCVKVAGGKKVVGG